MKPLTRPECVLVMYGFALNDPPARQAAEFMSRQGYQVTIIQTAPEHPVYPHPPSSVQVQTISLPSRFSWFRPLNSWERWRYFTKQVRTTLELKRPQLVVTIMLHALAALPPRRRFGQSMLLSCIYDIHPLEFAGKLDRRIMQQGWNRLAESDLVWASDTYKGDLAKRMGQLITSPLICYNCPSIDYLPQPTVPRDRWLRDKLREQGAAMNETGGSILLRAGAVGEHGGIEDTLAVMHAMPKDYIFLMMGRPPGAYRENLLTLIAKLGLEKRAFLWDRPDDLTWIRAIQGADIGHLIHGPYPPGRMKRQFDLNSSLSNNRLFQYMAAGLPILSYDDLRMSAIHDEVPCFRVARTSELEGSILGAWQELGADAELRTQLGNAGRTAHLEKYNWEQQFRPVVAALQDILPRTK